MAHPYSNSQRLRHPTGWQPSDHPQRQETQPSNFVASNLLKKISHIVANDTNLTRQNSPQTDLPITTESAEWIDITELLSNHEKERSKKKKKVVDVLDVQIFPPNKPEDTRVLVQQSLIDRVIDSSFAQETGEDWADVYVVEDEGDETESAIQTEEPVEEKIEVSDVQLEERKEEIENADDTIVISEDEDDQPNKRKKSQCFRCPHCSYETLRKGALTVHMKYIHSATSDWFKCGICKYSAFTQTQIDLHAKSHRIKSSGFYCKCSFSSTNETRFYRHMEQAHNVAVRWFHCNSCKHKFPSCTDLKEMRKRGWYSGHKCPNQEKKK